jgi:hypothetical protein
MAEFNIQRLSVEARSRIATALRTAGLEVDPPLATVDRRDTVVLSAPTRNKRLHSGPKSERSTSLADVLTLRIARPGAAIETVDIDGPSTVKRGVRWFNVADTSHVDAAELLGIAGPYCRGELTLEMVEDLISPDPRPKIQPWAGGTIKGVAAFRVTASESDEGVGMDSATKAGILIFEPVEFLVGADWLITCWHDAEVYRGAERINERAPAPPTELFKEVGRCWQTRAVKSAGDLAVLILLELALTYGPACRQLYVWQEEWELDFFRRPDRIDRETLLDARACAAVLRDWLARLNPPGLRQDAERAWFPGVTGDRDSGGFERALEVDDRIDSALHELSEFNQTLRSAYDLLQLREGERERHRDDRFQRTIAVGGSAILIPTLVAGIMGVNTWVPGEAGPKSSHWAFVVLICIVLLSGGVAWAVLRNMRDDGEPRS